MLDGVRAQLAGRQHDHLAVARIDARRRQPAPHRLAHDGELVRARGEPQPQRRDRRRVHARRHQRDVVVAARAGQQRVDQPRAEPLGREPRALRRGLREPPEADVERLAAALDRAVGVQDQRRALRHRRDRVLVDVPERAVERHAARALEIARATVRGDEQRRRMPGGRVAHLARGRIDDRVDQRRAARAGDAVRVAAQQLQQPRRRAPLERVRAQRAAQLAHRRGGFGAVADDVADRDPQPPAGQLDDVVEVAARRGALGRQVADRDLEPVRARQRLRQQRLLERGRQVVLGLVDPRPAQRLAAQARQRQQVVAVVRPERRAGGRTRARSRPAPRRRRRAGAAPPTGPAGAPRESADTGRRSPPRSPATAAWSCARPRPAGARRPAAATGSARACPPHGRRRARARACAGARRAAPPRRCRRRARRGPGRRRWPRPPAASAPAPAPRSSPAAGRAGRWRAAGGDTAAPARAPGRPGARAPRAARARRGRTRASPSG